MSHKISTSEISKHAKPGDCWVVVNGKVYDLSNFAPNHPGGDSIIYAWAGKDASKPYNEFHRKSLIEDELGSSEKKGELDEATVTETWRKAHEEEREAGPEPDERPPLNSIINLADFEQAFARSGSKKANAYIAGASNDELTLRANADHWRRLWFRPRVMRDVSRARTATRMLGLDVSMPVFVAPMGVALVAGPEGEAALGAGAAAQGIVHCVSTVSSLPLDEVLASAPENPWFFQLYVDKNRAKSEALLRKLAARPQIKALFVTADLPVVSKREADERIRSALAPPTYDTGGPVSESTAADSKGGGIARNNGNFIDSSLAWEDVAWVKRHTDLPIIVKGIQSVADARAALQAGCAGIVVSNHGGRALDGAPSTAMVLLELRRDFPEAFERMEVFVDGGVRRGSDVLKALCLGARGVAVGRPFQCAVAYGRAGVEHCAEILRDELETAMRLCGVADVNQVRGDMGFLNTSELEALLPPKHEKYPPLRSRSWSKL